MLNCQLPLLLDQPAPSHRDMLLEIACQPNSALPSDLLRLVRESISLAEELDNGAHGGSSWLHGDLHPSNILWDGQQAAREVLLKERVRVLAREMGRPEVY